MLEWGGTLDPHTIDSPYFVPGNTYRFQLELKNYLQDSSTFVLKDVAVLEREIPQVRIVGPPTTETTRDKGKRVRAVADFPPSCEGEASGVELSYLWTVTPSAPFLWFGGTEIVFEEAALTAGKTYEVTVLVSDQKGAKNTASQTVRVKECPLMAIIDPMFVQTSTLNKITLSAASSFDPDGSTGVWSYDWVGTGVDNSNNGEDTLILEPGEVTPGVHIYSCTVTRTSDEVSKSANVTATVTVEQPSGNVSISGDSSTIPYPAVVIDKEGYSKVNMGTDPLVLPGRLEVVDERLLPATYSWEVSPQEGKRAYFATSTNSAITAINLGALREGVNYVFSLSALDALGRRSGSSVVIEVNTPPEGGLVEASPMEGRALDTIFELRAEGFYDDDLPLEYVFRQVHMEAGGEAWVSDAPLTGRMAENAANTMLSAGEEQGEWKTWVTVEVFDSIGAQAVADTQVTVKLMEEGAIDKMREFVKDAEMKKDGTGIAKYIESGARSIRGKILGGDTDDMMDSVGNAWEIVGGEEGVARIAGTVEVVSAKGEGKRGMEKGFKLIESIVETVGDFGGDVISSIVGTVDNTLAYKIGGTNETEIYDVLRNIGGR
jgi:hypothetical protein